MKEKIHLELSFEEVNLVLKALGNLPFNEVYELIGKVHEQANAQSVQTVDQENNKQKNK